MTHHSDIRQLRHWRVLTMAMQARAGKAHGSAWNALQRRGLATDGRLHDDVLMALALEDAEYMEARAA